LIPGGGDLHVPHIEDEVVDAVDGEAHQAISYSSIRSTVAVRRKAKYLTRRSRENHGGHGVEFFLPFGETKRSTAARSADIPSPCTPWFSLLLRVEMLASYVTCSARDHSNPS
jgi:hypothetical protein